MHGNKLMGVVIKTCPLVLRCQEKKLQRYTNLHILHSINTSSGEVMLNLSFGELLLGIMKQHVLFSYTLLLREVCNCNYRSARCNS